MGPKFFYRDIDLVYFVNNKLISNDLINQKDRVLLSFSGGQDSICLLFILNQLYSQFELDITFFWCHHLWQTDSFYLMQQMAKLSFLFQFNSCFAIPLNFISSEFLARKWRQSCNYRVSLFYNYSKICLAHTFNDKVETIFLNFMRGTGLVGLSPLRWTQLISKDNITNEKHISQQNDFSSRASESNGPNMCIPSMQGNKVFAMANPDKLKNLTKEIISKFINCSEFESFDPLALYAYSSISYPIGKRSVYPFIPWDIRAYPARGKGAEEALPQTPLLAKLNSFHPLPVIDSASASITSFTYTARQTHPLLTAYPTRACGAEEAGASLVKGKPQYQPARQGKSSIHIVSQTLRFIPRRGNTFISPGRTSEALSLKRFASTAGYSFASKERRSCLAVQQHYKPLWVRGLYSKVSPLRLVMLAERVSNWQSQERGPASYARQTLTGSTLRYFATRYPFTQYPEGVKRSNASLVQELEAERYSSVSKQLKDSCYITRPLLFISRIELNKICYFWELPIYPDKSNQKVKFLRNRVRRQLLPTIKLFFNSNIENIFLQLAKIVETEDYCLTAIMNKFTQKY